MELYPSIWTIFGQKYTAKSSIALTFPKKIAYYDLEMGAIRAWGWKELVDRGDVLPRSGNIPTRSLIRRYEMLHGYQAAWKAFVDQLDEDLQNESVKTVVIDTGSKLRALIRDAFLEYRQGERPGKKTLDQIEYAEPNRRTEDVMEAPRVAGKHLVVVYHETDEYAPVIGPDGQVVRDENNSVKREQTGKKIPNGYTHAEDASDWIFRTHLNDDRMPTANLLKSPYGLDLVDQEFKWLTYEKVVGMLKMRGRA